MTERLAQLLHDGADGLPVPAPPAADVLTRGRRLRRRRRATTGIAALAVVAVVGGTAYGAGTLGGSSDGQAREPASSVSDVGASFAVGTTVYLDDATVAARIDDRAVKSIYDTSAGTLVRHGDNPYSDDPGDQRYSLVGPGGAVRDISVTLVDTVPGVDPDQPYLAYAEKVDGTVEVVVHDLRTDEEVARVAVPDAKRWGGWTAPPVALDGDQVYVGTDDVLRVVDWRTGEVGERPDLPTGYPTVDGGHTVRDTAAQSEVLDVATGRVLLSVERDSDGYSTLSPDGRFVTVAEYDDMTGPESFDVYDVDTGDAVTIDGAAYDFGWTADGGLFGVGADGVLTTCSPTTGECTEEKLALDPPPEPNGDDPATSLRLGGRAYES